MMPQQPPLRCASDCPCLPAVCPSASVPAAVVSVSADPSQTAPRIKAERAWRTGATAQQQRMASEHRIRPLPPPLAPAPLLPDSAESALDQRPDGAHAGGLIARSNEGSLTSRSEHQPARFVSRVGGVPVVL